MVEQYLRDYGYDGLCTHDCGCFLGDLAPCGAINPDCKPGHKVWSSDEQCFVIKEKRNIEYFARGGLSLSISTDGLEIINKRD